MDKARQQAEKEVREKVADAESLLAQRHVRESFRRNRFAALLYVIALVTPALFLGSFYTAKAREIRENFRDPYELPPNFDAAKGQFVDKEAERQFTQHVSTPPNPLFVGGEAPGSYGPRGRKRPSV